MAVKSLTSQGQLPSNPKGSAFRAVNVKEIVPKASEITAFSASFQQLGGNQVLLPPKPKRTRHMAVKSLTGRELSAF
jgi:hypothetical protein